jgi:hypothetical protein
MGSSTDSNFPDVILDSQKKANRNKNHEIKMLLLFPRILRRAQRYAQLKPMKLTVDICYEKKEKQKKRSINFTANTSAKKLPQLQP